MHPILQHPLFHRLLRPFWQRAPWWLRRWLIWQGTPKFIVGVAAICLNPQGEMLLLNHRFHPDFPWGFPGGWVDRGETPTAAVLREIDEETGLGATLQGVLHLGGDGKWVEIYYLCHVPDGPLHLQASEVRGYRWVDPLNCPLPLHPRQAIVLDLFLARLTQQL